MSFRIAGLDVEVKPTIAPGEKAADAYDTFCPSTTELPRGHRRTPENKAFEATTIFEKDVALPMRDGVKLYCDVFRPKTTEKVPAILMWSPYGKTGNGPHGLDMLPGRFGVPRSQVSGYEKFEGLDPATWTARGYAIVNVDLRGSWDSEGIIPWLGDQDGKDGYDAIEYIARLQWCTGKVAFGGNSWLAMVQWVIASQRPPSLAAIAPWEGNTDFYRDTLCRGGVPYPYDAMWGMLQDTMVGRFGTEAAVAMLEKHPLYDAYWEDKRAKLELIDVPAYVLASYSSSLHTSGSIRGYNKIFSKDKWLRIHHRQEWSDLYAPENVDDLNRFYDCFLKDRHNGWKRTPAVRVSLLGFNRPPVINLPFSSYPVPDSHVKRTKLYLGAGGKLANTPFQESGSATYNAAFCPPKGPLKGEEELFFSHKFSRETWLLGYSWLVLHISNESDNDIDVFVQLGKADVSGKLLQNMNVPLEALQPPASDASEVVDSCFLKYLGPTGALRASHAITKTRPGPGTFTGEWPEYSSTSRKTIPSGTVVRLEIPIWPTGIIYGAGESLTLKVSGHYMSYMEFPSLYGASHKNKGRHMVRFGGDYDSHLVVPLAGPISHESAAGGTDARL